MFRDVTCERYDDDYYYDQEEDPTCWQCGGDGYGIVGADWDNDDPVNEPDGVIQQCPCCGGTGLAKDCRYW